MSSSYAYTQTYVQLKIFFSLIEKAEDQDVDMLDIHKSRHRAWSINNYHLLSTNIYFKFYIIICIQFNCAVSMVSADQKKKSAILKFRKTLKSNTFFPSLEHGCLLSHFCSVSQLGGGGSAPTRGLSFMPIANVPPQTPGSDGPL